MLSFKIKLFKLAVLVILVCSNFLNADPITDLKIRNYGSFIFTDEAPNALFFFNNIEKMDSFNLRKALRSHNIDTLILASPGGSVDEGLNMAGIIFDKKLNTYIPKNSNCASACSYMFFAGKKRQIDGKLGVHQFYDGNGSADAKIVDTMHHTQYVASEIIGFLNEFGTPPFVFERMFQQDKIYYFYPEELKKLVTEDDPDQFKMRTEANLFIEKFNEALNDYKDKEKSADSIPKVLDTNTHQIKLSKSKIIKSIQKELNRLNCKAGTADGIFGDRSRTALVSWAKLANETSVSVSKFSIIKNDQEILSLLKKSLIFCNSNREMTEGVKIRIAKNMTGTADCKKNGWKKTYSVKVSNKVKNIDNKEVLIATIDFDNYTHEVKCIRGGMKECNEVYPNENEKLHFKIDTSSLRYKDKIGKYGICFFKVR